MSAGRDPFYVGSNTDYKKALWFRKMWDRFGRPGLHLRGLHYILQREGKILRPDGQVYINTTACWSYLDHAFTLARYLGHIPFGELQDNKSPGVSDKFLDESCPYEIPESVIVKDNIYGVNFSPHINWNDSKELMEMEASRILDEVFMSVSYDPMQWHPYYLSVWSEKRFTEIEDACWGKANYVPNIGVATIEQTHKEIERIREFGKPAIVFYLSDFDPKGRDMPISVSRVLEAYSKNVGPRVRLISLAITPEQVLEYQLPRSPIKRGTPETTGVGAKAYNTLREVFQNVHGEGAVEMDSFVSLYPGELERLIEEALDPWLDHDLEKKLHEAQKNLKRKVEERIRERFLECSEELEEVRERLGVKIGQLAKIHDETIEDLDLNEDMKEFREILDSLNIDFDVGGIELEDGCAPGEERDWLLDTSRNYLDQIEAYKKYDMRYQEPNDSKRKN